MVVRLVSGSTNPSSGAESLYEHILDNRDRTVVDYLRGGLSDAGLFRVVSAFFTIYGFELLEDMLGGVRETRFLFGDPGSVDKLDPAEKDAQFFEVTEGGLVPGVVLRQKHLARRCYEWMRDDAVGVRGWGRGGGGQLQFHETGVGWGRVSEFGNQLGHRRPAFAG